MTRRDTIIVAALVNAGLLVVLFVSALKNEEGRGDIAYKALEVSQSTSQSPIRSEVKKVTGDEVEQVLRQYVALETPAKKDEGPVSSFVEDLSKIRPPVTTVPIQEVKEQEHIVEKGDMLEKIARRYKTSVAELMKINQLPNSQLKVGQVLKIPAAVEKKLESALKDPEDSLLNSAKYYVVKPGDNPWTIAVKNHIKVEELLKLNDMSEEKARKLRPGDKIRIR